MSQEPMYAKPGPRPADGHYVEATIQGRIANGQQEPSEVVRGFIQDRRVEINDSTLRSFAVFLAKDWMSFEAAQAAEVSELVWLPEETCQTVTAKTLISVDSGDWGRMPVGYVTATHDLAAAGFYGGQANLEIVATSTYSDPDPADPAACALPDRRGERRQFWPCWPEVTCSDHVEAYRAAVAWVKERYTAQALADRREHISRAGVEA